MTHIEVLGEQFPVDSSDGCKLRVGVLLAAIDSGPVGGYEPTKACAVFRRAGNIWSTSSVRGVRLNIRYDGRDYILEREYAGAKYPSEICRMESLCSAILRANML